MATGSAANETDKPNTGDLNKSQLRLRRSLKDPHSAKICLHITFERRFQITQTLGSHCLLQHGTIAFCFKHVVFSGRPRVIQTKSRDPYLCGSTFLRKEKENGSSLLSIEKTRYYLSSQKMVSPLHREERQTHSLAVRIIRFSWTV